MAGLICAFTPLGPFPKRQYWATKWCNVAPNIFDYAIWRQHGSNIELRARELNLLKYNLAFMIYVSTSVLIVYVFPPLPFDSQEWVRRWSYVCFSLYGYHSLHS